MDDARDVVGLVAPGGVNELESDFFALIERLVAVLIDLREVNEYVVILFSVDDDEAIPALRVKPFDVSY